MKLFFSAKHTNLERQKVKLQQLIYQYTEFVELWLCGTNFQARTGPIELMGGGVLVPSSHGQLQLTGQNLGRVFNFQFGHLQAEHFRCYQVKLPNLKLKTQIKQLLGFLPLVIALPNLAQPQGPLPRIPRLAKFAGKMDLMKSQFDELSHL